VVDSHIAAVLCSSLRPITIRSHDEKKTPLLAFLKIRWSRIPRVFPYERTLPSSLKEKEESGDHATAREKALFFSALFLISVLRKEQSIEFEELGDEFRDQERKHILYAHQDMDDACGAQTIFFYIDPFRFLCFASLFFSRYSDSIISCWICPALRPP
jgi:hypothetical protein